MSSSSDWHFDDDTVRFLNDLKVNNNRDWFQANKATFETVYKQPAEFFCQLMAERMSEAFGDSYTPKLYRIYRDVRFSKDKTPYNAHLHISFSPVGQKMPAFFFGLQPENLVLGAGTFGFQGGVLDAYRQRVLGSDGADLQSIVDALADKGYRLSEPALKRVPRGLPADHPRTDLLRHKGLAAWFDFPDASHATSPKLFETCLDKFSDLKPLVEWLRSLD